MSSATSENTKEIKLGKFKFERVSNFTYLRSSLNFENKMPATIQERIQAKAHIYKTPNNSNLSKITKLGLYKAFIRPVLTYCSEI